MQRMEIQMELFSHIVALSLLAKENESEIQTENNANEDFFWHHIVPEIEDEKKEQDQESGYEDDGF